MAARGYSVIAMKKYQRGYEHRGMLLARFQLFRQPEIARRVLAIYYSESRPRTTSGTRISRTFLNRFVLSVAAEVFIRLGAGGNVDKVRRDKHYDATDGFCRPLLNVTFLRTGITINRSHCLALRPRIANRVATRNELRIST